MLIATVANCAGHLFAVPSVCSHQRRNVTPPGRRQRTLGIVLTVNGAAGSDVRTSEDSGSLLPVSPTASAAAGTALCGAASVEPSSDRYAL